MKAFKTIFLFLLLGLAALPWFMGPEPEPEVDPELESLVTEWRSDMEAAGIDYYKGFCRINRIRIVENADYGGHYSEGSKEIMISREQIKKGSFSAKAALYHELGHFVFKLDHDGSNTIMHYKSKQEDYYRLHWEPMKEYYIKKCKVNEFEGKY